MIRVTITLTHYRDEKKVTRLVTVITDMGGVKEGKFFHDFTDAMLFVNDLCEKFRKAECETTFVSTTVIV